MRRSSLAWFPTLTLFALAGCGGSDAAPEAEEMPMEEEAPMAEEVPTGPPSVTIAEPADGSEVDGPDVQVVLETTGLRIVEAGVMDPATGHHHLFVNADVTPAGEVIPAGNPAIIHMGDGSTSFVLTGFTGEVRLIAVVADGMHVPLEPMVADTVTFEILEGL